MRYINTYITLSSCIHWQGSSQKKTENKKYDYIVGGAVNDRSFLSDEMADLCAKLPIYRIKTVMGEESPKRKLNCCFLPGLIKIKNIYQEVL